MIRCAVALILLCFVSALAACNTVAGLGRDVEAVGGGVAGDSANAKRR